MGKENLELCVVEAKIFGETIKTTREFLQVFVWGYKRDEENE